MPHDETMAGAEEGCVLVLSWQRNMALAALLDDLQGFNMICSICSKLMSRQQVPGLVHQLQGGKRPRCA